MRNRLTVPVVNIFLRTALFMLFIVIGGCSKTVPVGSISGQATCKGKPLTTGEIVLSSPDWKQSAAGELDMNGKFNLRKPLPPGKYQVAWVPPSPTVADIGEAPQKQIVYPVSVKRQNIETTDLTFEVTDGENNANFEF